MALLHVKNQDFFHIHKIGLWSDRWAVGKTIFRGNKELNLFSQFYNENYPFIVGPDGIKYPGNRAIPYFLSQSLQYQNQNLQNILNFAKTVIQEQGMFIREEIFEEVRKNYFPHLPSRRTCIWLCDKESVEYWWSKLQSPNLKMKIFKFNITGILLRTDQKHLLHESVSHDTLRAKAFEYWTGSDGLNPVEEELLFEGIIRIVEEYPDLQSFSQKTLE
jgi:hypothetical protein